jgi:hypothetical protein
MFAGIGPAAPCSHDRDVCPFFLQSKVRNPKFHILIVILREENYFFTFELHTPFLLPFIS